MNWDHIIAFAVENIVPVVVASFKNHTQGVSDSEICWHATRTVQVLIDGIAAVHDVEPPNVKPHVAEAMAQVSR